MQRASIRRIFIGIAFFTGCIGLAVGGYVLAGWDLLDAIYMVAITITGVGYGEVRPIDSPALKLFTIFVIITGTVAMVYVVSGVIQLITEGEINRILGVKRMTKGISRLDHPILICGFGRVGQVLARRLENEKTPFIVIDENPARISEAEGHGFLVLQGDATEDETLMTAGIQRAQALAAVLPADAVNVLITLTARGMNPNLRIIARGERPSSERKLLQAGATQVVLPAAICAQRMTDIIVRPSAEEWMRDAERRNMLNRELDLFDVSIGQLLIPPDSPLVGAALREIESKATGSFLVIAIDRGERGVLQHPGPEVTIEAGDTLVTLGHSEELPDFRRRFVQASGVTYRGTNAR